jgi:hypothetical protein
MGGAWGDATGALIVFHGTKDDVERFAERDPCVAFGAFKLRMQLHKTWNCRKLGVQGMGDGCYKILNSHRGVVVQFKEINPLRSHPSRNHASLEA